MAKIGTKRRLIADSVRDRIIAGEHKPGHRLPGVAEICEEFDVSTATAVNAMGDLADDGYVLALQGDGYFVRTKLPAMAPAEKAAETVEDVVTVLREEARRLNAVADTLEALGEYKFSDS